MKGDEFLEELSDWKRLKTDTVKDRVLLSQPIVWYLVRI